MDDIHAVAAAAAAVAPAAPAHALAIEILSSAEVVSISGPPSSRSFRDVVSLKVRCTNAADPAVYRGPHRPGDDNPSASQIEVSRFCFAGLETANVLDHGKLERVLQEFRRPNLLHEARALAPLVLPAASSSSSSSAGAATSRTSRRRTAARARITRGP